MPSGIPRGHGVPVNRIIGRVSILHSITPTGAGLVRVQRLEQLRAISSAQSCILSVCLGWPRYCDIFDRTGFSRMAQGSAARCRSGALAGVIPHVVSGNGAAWQRQSSLAAAVLGMGGDAQGLRPARKNFSFCFARRGVRIGIAH